MTIASFDQYIAAAKQQVRIVKTAGATTIAAQPFTTLDLAGLPGAGSLAVGNTANGLVPTDATAGFPLINAFGVGNVGVIGSVDFGSSVAGRLTIYDRIFHAGSYALTPTGTTTLASQPSYTGRLPSGPDYGNLELFLEVNVAIAASAVTVQIGYTSENGSGRTTIVTASLASLTTRRLIPLALQAGDKEIRSIDSFIVGGTAAATGSINIVLARRLWANRARVANDGALDDIGATGLPQVFDTSALWLMVEADSTSSGVPEVLLTIANG
jgi:hypothetical protein